jgi:arginyl-tRNA synthetase
MLAWQKWGNGATPESTGKKGDHLIGDFYVLFDKKYKAEIKEIAEAQGITEEEANEIARKVGLGALKYFILKVDPRKNMLFNPAESIDFNGNTGPFIQYTYARIQSVLRKSGAERESNGTILDFTPELDQKELALIQRLCEYPSAVRTAGDEFSPAVICNYAYALACDFNSFYHDLSILNEKDEQKRALRLLLAKNVAKVLQSAMSLLGIEMPERM